MSEARKVYRFVEGEEPPPTSASAFLCYGTRKAKEPDGQTLPTFKPRKGERSDDAYGSRGIDVKKTKETCNPGIIGFNAPGETGPTHLVGYKVRAERGFAKTLRTVENGFTGDPVQVEVIKPDLLFVPSSQALGTGGVPPLNPADEITPLQCYKVKPTGLVRQRNVGLREEFSGQRLYLLFKPTRLCLPARLSCGAEPDPAAPLMICYQAERPITFVGERFEPRAVSTNDTFGEQVVNAKKIVELCVPTTDG